MDARVDQVGQNIDFQTFSQNIRDIIELHFHSAFGRIALRVIPCPNICSGALNMLCEVRGNYGLAGDNYSGWSLGTEGGGSGWSLGTEGGVDGAWELRKEWVEPGN